MASTELSSIFELPTNKSFQFAGNTDGSVGQDVNQFQGAVTFSVPLISLPGRSGLNLDVAVAYNSSISEQVGESNRDAPTGVLGLGWDLLIDRIDAEYTTPGNRDSAVFVLVSHGVTNRLYWTDRPWQRGVLASSFASTLDQGKLSTALIAALLEQSLVVDSSAAVKVLTSGKQWQITDPVNEYILYISADDLNTQQLLVLDGGIGYELESFDFSRVRYYAPFERWEIFATSGSCRVFGGGFKTGAEGNTSRGESIVWGVKWNTWSGPSMVTLDNRGQRTQSQYPLSWHLSSERAINRDEISFSYHQVQQPVGQVGLPYTKAIYLQLIKDMFDRTATFTYAAKDFNDEPSKPREYLDPYKSHPNDVPDAYQSRYETLYLDNVVCRNAQKQELFTSTLKYELGLFCSIPGNAPPFFAGDRYKRVLTSIQQTDDEGVGLPPMLFSYSSVNELNSGAIATKVLPEGATVQYLYQQKSLTACLRKLNITPVLTSATPRIWFGPDYAVVAWIAVDRFSITVFTWSGRWIAWQPSARVYQFSGDANDIIVNLEEDFFVLSLGHPSSLQSIVLFFHKNNRVLGGWLESSDSPLMLPTANRSIASGGRFFAVSNGQNNTVVRYTWNNAQRQWMKLPLPTPPEAQDPQRYHIFLAGAANILTALYYDRLSSPGNKQSLLVLNYVDEGGAWFEGSRRTAKEISIAGATEAELRSNFQWNSSPWVFAASAITQENNSNLLYQITLYTWGSNAAPGYVWNNPFQLSCSIAKTNTGSLPYSPTAQIQDTGMVTSGPYLLRFNGQAWLVNQNLRLQLPVVDGTVFWFAQGRDVVLKTENSQNQIIGMAQVFDPNTETGSWTEAPINLYNSPPSDPRLTSYFPTANQDFISFNRTFYYRGTSSNWIEPVQKPIPGLPLGSNATTLINESPGFMVYLQESNQQPVQTNVLLLNSGFVASTENILQSFFRAIEPDGTVDPNTNGKTPAGAGSFVTFLPLNAKFDQAQSLTLYRFLNNSITQAITDFPVLSVSVDDGYSVKEYRYEFDGTTAAVNPQGYSCKYYNSSVRTGDGSLSGNTRFTFINGVGNQAPGNPVQDAALDGQLLRKDLFDAPGNLVSSQTNTWNAVDQVQDWQTGTVRPLDGVYVQLAANTNMLDGVESGQSFSYDAASGQTVSTSVTVWNALGREEIQARRVVLGYTAYPLLGYLNMLQQQVGSVSTSVDGVVPPVVTAQQSLLMKLFPGLPMGAAGALQLLLPWQMYARSKPGNGTPTQAPDEWVLQAHVETCNPWGYPTEITNAVGLVTSKLYSGDNSSIVAVFAGASILGQAGYYFGFEPYETSGPWRPDYAKTPLVTTICNTGTQCMSLPPGVSGTPLELTPQDRSEPFLFGFWGTLDPAASSPVSATAWRIEFFSLESTDVPPVQTIAVTSTDWKYYCASIDLRSASAPVTVRCTPVNSGKTSIFVDNVCFSTLQGGVRAQVFNPTNFLITEGVGPNNEITRNIYDRQQRQIGSTSEFQTVVNVIAPYLSRQTQPEFNPASPNSQLVFQPMGQTCYERFLNNGVWANHFSSPQPAFWQSDRGVLRYTGGAGGAITFTQPSFTANYAMRFNLQLDSGSLISVGVKFGQNVRISWNPQTREWQLTDTPNNRVIKSRILSNTPAGDWTAILSTEAVIFALNGEVIFDYLPGSAPSGAPTITVEGPVSIRQFIIGAEPQLAMKYFDGSSKSIQGQSIEGTQAVVAALLYDTLGRPAVRVKAVSYSGVNGSTGSLIALRTDVVTSFDWTTGVLAGKAAMAYPSDEGYPYIRQTMENSPLERILESSAPGKQFSITSLDRTARHTVRYTYGSNDNATINSALGLPAGHYRSTTVMDQDGRITVNLSDTIGQAIGSATLLDAATQKWLFNLQSKTYSSEGSVSTVRLPNFYAPPSGSTASAWVNVTQRDLLGITSSGTTPDAGTAKFIANNLGKNRFSQNAATASLGLILYTKYDLFGRIVEGGVVPGTWDVELLKQRANVAGWPTAIDGARPIRTFEYGSDAAQVNNLARLVRMASYDPVTQQPVTSNTNDYDEAGKVASYSLFLNQGGNSYTTRYTYDNLGNVASTVYASGFTVITERDPVGRIHQLKDGSGQVLAAYSYAPDDQVIEQTILPGTPGAVTLSYAYTSPGWLQQLSSTCMTESLTYTSGSYSGVPYYSGRIGSAETQFHNLSKPPSNFPADLTYSYSYDTRGQLQTAQATANGSVQPAYSFGLGQATTYDSNGNFLSVSDGGTVENYVYTTNTNKVRNNDGSQKDEFQSNAVGAVTKAEPRSITNIEYQVMTQETVSIQTASQGQLNFQYDTQSNRVRKVTDSGSLIYVRGVNGWPLVEWSTTDTGQAVATEYLYGTKGIFAIRQGGKILPVLTDHLNSVRALVGPDGRVQAAFHYSPFGKVVAEFGGADELRYRFTGYEYDKETGLYNASARLYDPSLKRFYSVDPQMQFYSPYLYCGNNPISVVDPTGEAAWWAILVGAVVGIIATVATGGALAPAVAGLEGAALTAATVGVAATAGAVGSIAGDATTAGLSGEKFTATRALVDIAGGAAGGGVGAFVGAPAASLAMRGALSLSEEISARAVSTIGTITAGVVGGTAGAVAQSAVTSAMTGQSFFSVSTAVNIIIGGAAGFGGSLLGSGAHMGWGGDTMPVPLGRQDFDLIRRNVFAGDAGYGSLISFNRNRAEYAFNESMYQLNPANAVKHDVINMHGSRGMVYVTIATRGGLMYERPLSPKLLGEFLNTRMQDRLGNNPTIKLAICYGGKGGWFSKSAGQTLATALGRDVYGAKGTTYSPSGSPDHEWIRFQP